MAGAGCSARDAAGANPDLRASRPPLFPNPEILYAAAVGTPGSACPAATAALMEAITTMFFLASNVYRTIKEIGRKEGFAKGIAEGREIGRERGRKISGEVGKEEGFAEGMSIGRERGREIGREIGRKEGFAEGVFIGVDAALDAMREAGVDEDARRQVEDILARRAWAQRRAAAGRAFARAGQGESPRPRNPENPS